jgi:hypothetical protein
MDPAKAIDEVLALGLAGALKRAGFKKSARTFRRALDGAIQVVNVQASQSNGPAARFTVNLGVYRAEIAALLAPSLPLTTQPKEYQCVVRERIGFLMPKGADHWWEVRPHGSIDNERLAGEVADAVLGYGLPWLESNFSIGAIRETLSAHPTLVTAAASIAAGDLHGGIEIAETVAVARPAAAPKVREWINQMLTAAAGA